MKNDKMQEKVNELNAYYGGTFRGLSEKERDYYSDLLNTDENEWYEPYAIREASNDVISIYDSIYDVTNSLFTRISNDQLYKD